MLTDSAAVIANWLPAIDLSSLPSGFNVAKQLDSVYIPMAQKYLEAQWGQTLEQESLVDVAMDGSGDYGICLPHFPIQTVTACRVVFGFERTIYSFTTIRHLASRLLNLPQDWHNGDPGGLPDMFVDRDSGILNIDLTGSLLSLAAMPGTYPIWQVNFPGGPRDVKASYVHGYPADQLPPEVVNACGMVAASFLAAMGQTRKTGGATSIKIGSVQQTFSAGAAAPAMNEVWKMYVDDAVRRWSQKPLGN